MENIKQKSYKAFAWDFAGKIGGQSVGFIISIFLARLLSPDDFGLLAMVNVVIALSASLMDMGLGVALIQRKEVRDEHYGSVFFFNIVVGLLLASALFFSAPLIGRFYEREILVPMARAMSVLFLLNSVGNVLRLKLRKELEYGIPTRAGLLSALLSGAVGVGLAFGGFGVWSLVVQSLLNPILSNIYLFYYVKWRPRLVFQFQALKELWGFGFRMFISGILDTIFNQADSIIIGKLFSPAMLGQYYRARSLNNYVVQYSSGSIMSVLFPALSMLQDDPDKLKEMVRKGFHLIAFMAFFLSGLFFVIGADLILLLFGSKWEPAIQLFHLIMLTAYGYPLSSLLVNILSAKGNSKAFLKLEVIKKVLFGSALAFGFIWGIKGFLIFQAVAYAGAVYANMVFAGKELNTGAGWFLKMTLPYLALVMILVGCLQMAQYYLNSSPLVHLFLGGGLFVLTYMGLALLLNLQGLVLARQELTRLVVPRVKQAWNTLTSRN